MKNYFENSKGFGLIGLVLAVAIVAGIVFGGLYWAGNDANPLMDADDKRLNSPAGAIGALEQAKKDIGAIGGKADGRRQTAESIMQETEQTTDNGQQITGGNDLIEVYNISEGDSVSSPAVIEGETLLDVDELMVELRNQDHQPLVQETTTVRNGEFGITLNFEFNNTEQGFIAVYNVNIEDTIEIPVAFDTE